MVEMRRRTQHGLLLSSSSRQDREDEDRRSMDNRGPVGELWLASEFRWELSPPDELEGERRTRSEAERSLIQHDCRNDRRT